MLEEKQESVNTNLRTGLERIGNLLAFAFIGWGEATHALALGCTPLDAGAPLGLAGLLDLMLQVVRAVPYAVPLQARHLLSASFLGLSLP